MNSVASTESSQPLPPPSSATSSNRPHYAADDAEFRTYLKQGETRALALDNRGPIRFNADGSLSNDIKRSYQQYGFYVFTGVVDHDELKELRGEVDRMIEYAPLRPGETQDRYGRPILGQEFAVPTYLLVPPLSDPVGGTNKNHGRHPVPMNEPEAHSNAPEFVVHMLFGLCQTMDACLRLYGHPSLLKVAEAINGEDFTPYNDAIFVKQPGLGASVAWHQDGIVHWNKPDWDEGTHGFNFMIQLYGSSAGSGVWIVPGTHKLGKVDIKAMVDANAGSDRLPQAVPLVCEAGDAFICNRQAVHGSFANTSPDMRVTINFGFHRRASVLNAPAALTSKSNVIYDAERIQARSRIIALGIDARRQRYALETPFVYRPTEKEDIRWNEETRQTLLKDYNLKDLGI